jgi:DNA-binding response OmpR family regulator
MVALTGNERRLMKSLFHADGSVMKREALLEALSTDGGLDIDPHRLDSVIHRLRSKVARHTSAPFPLLAVYGEGYVLRTV